MKILRPETEVQWFGTVDDGKQLELNATFDGKSKILANIVAEDKDVSLWFEFYLEEKIIQIPLERIQELINLAPGEVHSETWYEENVYGSDNT